jgi:GntP family gluconate:H+ symporter
MLTGFPLLILIVAVLAFIILACTVFRWHPFLVLLIAAITMGLSSGMTAEGTINTLLQGGGSVFANIGIIIALGTILGEAMEKTGAVMAIAKTIFSRLGSKRILPGISLIGAFTGIPVFCDSGFVILTSLARSLARRSSATFGAISVALATGLYTTHVLIPPTPGPLAAVGNFDMSKDIGWVIVMGMIVSVPSIVVGWWFANKLNSHEEDAQKENISEVKDHQHLPGFFSSLVPILLPVILIAFGSFIPLLTVPPRLGSILLFICNPNIALLISVLSAFTLLGYANKKDWNAWIQNALIQAGPIILITAAGGALGAILKATPLANVFQTLLAGNSFSMTFFFLITFLLAAGLKTAQGSSTASLIITSSIIAPLVSSLPVDHVAEKALLVLSIGAGAMSVSHANDSYFWVISQYSQIPVGKMYRYFTAATFFMGLAVLCSCMLLSLFF